MAYWSYERWDLALEDLILHCRADLVPGVVPYFDGKHWKLIELASVAEDLPKLIEELKEFKEDFNKEVESIMGQVNELFDKAEELAKDNPEEVRFILVQMDWDHETTTYNEWITKDTDATPTWLSGEPNGVIEHYVGDWFITVKSDKDESGIVRLRLSKPKANAFLNSL